MLELSPLWALAFQLCLVGRCPTEATRLRFDKKKITLQLLTGRTFSSKWLFSHQRDHDVMTTRYEFSVVDYFVDRILAASPQWEIGLTLPVGLFFLFFRIFLHTDLLYCAHRSHMNYHFPSS
jgi:hypothetical protein